LFIYVGGSLKYDEKYGQNFSVCGRGHVSARDAHEGVAEKAVRGGNQRSRVRTRMTFEKIPRKF